MGTDIFVTFCYVVQCRPDEITKLNKSLCKGISKFDNYPRSYKCLFIVPY